MGNSGSASRRRRNSNHRQHHHHPEPPSVLPPQPPPPPPPPQQQEAAGNRYVFAAATPYPAQYPNPNPPPYYQYAGYYPPPPPAMPVPLPAPFDHHHHHHHPQPHHGWPGTVQRYPCTSANLPPPYVEHQKAVTIRNDVNIKKETLRVEPDEENPGKSLITFTFDATTAGRISVIFFAKEGFDCNLSSVKDVVLEPVTVSFEEGLGQKFKQPFGTGIDFSVFEKEELLEGEMEVYPLAVKAEASPSDKKGAMDENHSTDITPNSQITLAVFEKKENGKYQVRVVKQILWVNGTRYELQEIYGIGNSVEGDPAGNDPGKECVICLSEPRDTTVLPCRHMCMCSGCAKVLRLQTDRCPICRQPVERLLEIRVNNRGEESQEVPC